MDKFKLTITLVAEGGELKEADRIKLRNQMAMVLNFNLDPVPYMTKRPTGSIYWEGKEEKL